MGIQAVGKFNLDHELLFLPASGSSDGGLTTMPEQRPNSWRMSREGEAREACRRSGDPTTFTSWEAAFKPKRSTFCATILIPTTCLAR